MVQKNWAGGGSYYQLNEGIVSTGQVEDIKSISTILSFVLKGYTGEVPPTFDNKEFTVQVGKQVSVNALRIMFKIYDPIEWSQNTMEHEVVAGFTTQIVYTETRILSSSNPQSIQGVRDLIFQKMVSIYQSYK